MASSLILNVLQGNFDSVLSLPDEGMVSMFKTLESSGLCGFLGFSTAIYENDLVNFFENAFVRKNDVINSVQVQNRERVEELKSELSQKITKLELAFAQSTSQQDMVFRAQINDVRREVQIQKAALKQELTASRFETQEGFSTLRAQLSEIIAYINRGRDDKKGKGSNSGPQPEDRSRPVGGGGCGSRSEPSKRGSSSYKGRVTTSSGFSRWFS
ncbi:hypothetical protein F511_27029 [Dorcoceras hygrometricum]|uniref:Uncharacterized protein n=1 Tax=Dorcoceras hygrometricum TaxID=472368 RepID=A0A2Z7CK32_9LAMI|nr:hypothetical protein F511_27029 [Dorcoceras hygrometricum]